MVDKVSKVQDLYKRDVLYELNILKKAFDGININIYKLKLAKDLTVGEYMSNYLRLKVSNKQHYEVTLLDDFVRNAPIEKTINLSKKIFEMLGQLLFDEKKLLAFYDENNLKERYFSQLEKERLNNIIVNTYLKCDRVDNANKFLLESFRRG